MYRTGGVSGSVRLVADMGVMTATTVVFGGAQDLVGILS